MTSIKFQGDDAFLKAMQHAIKEVPDVAQKIIKNHTESGKRKARQLAPVDTWFLKDHIYTYYEPMEGYIHSPAMYSGYQEFGTRYMYAQPFIKPTMEWLLPRVKKDMLAATKGLLR